jgi:sugar phosphate permease
VSCIGEDKFNALYILIFFLGLTLSGACNILASTIGIEMGKQLGGQSKSLGTIIGIIDGSGSLGASCGQLIISMIISQSDWQWAWIWLSIFILTGFVFLLKFIFRDLRKIASNED